MKTVSALTCAFAALTILPASSKEAAVHGDPYIPVGTLDIDKLWVPAGLRPQLTWEIRYPQFIDDIVEINPDDSLETKQRTQMEIRVVGAAFQIGSTHTPLAVQTRVGQSSGWEMIFLGNDGAVQPQEVVYTAIVEAGTKIDFSAQAQKTNGDWYSSRDTQTANPTVAALTNGDPVPDYVPAYAQGDVVSFLTQYIDEDSRIEVGPRDVVYTFELYATDPSNSYFDMQDMVIVVTFNDIEE